jgi:hypothetical protein
MSDLLDRIAAYVDDLVILTEYEGRLLTWVGRQRFANARRLNRDPGQGPPHTADGNDIRAAHSEFAASLLLNRSWRPTIGEICHPDVGDIVEVRSTDLENGRLIVKPNDKDDAPFVLILADMEGLRFYFAGWMLGRAAKEWPTEYRYGHSAHYVPQSALSSRLSLVAWLALREAGE